MSSGVGTFRSSTTIPSGWRMQICDSRPPKILIAAIAALIAWWVR